MQAHLVATNNGGSGLGNYFSQLTPSTSASQT